LERSREIRLGFVGTGVVGASLAEALAQAGYRVTAVSSRNPAHSRDLASRLPEAQAADSPQVVADRADIVFLTVPDDAIRSVAESIRWAASQAAVHCNGAASTELLETAATAGADTGAFHPLQSFASVAQARANLPGSTFAIEASSDALESALTDMARALGGFPMTLHGSKVLYHASAVIASNFLVTLLDLAAGLWSHLDIGKEESLRALLPLVRGTVENLEKVGLPGCLTGPIARGDAGTVKRHLAELEAAAPELVPFYRELACKTIPIALAKGRIGEQDAKRLAEVLNQEPGES